VEDDLETSVAVSCGTTSLEEAAEGVLGPKVQVDPMESHKIHIVA